MAPQEYQHHLYDYILDSLRRRYCCLERLPSFQSVTVALEIRIVLLPWMILETDTEISKNRARCNVSQGESVLDQKFAVTGPSSKLVETTIDLSSLARSPFLAGRWALLFEEHQYTCVADAVGDDFEGVSRQYYLSSQSFEGPTLDFLRKELILSALGYQSQVVGRRKLIFDPV